MYIYGGFLQWYPKIIQHCLFSMGKPMVWGTHILGNPLFSHVRSLANNRTNHLWVILPPISRAIYPIISITWFIVVVPYLS